MESGDCCEALGKKKKAKYNLERNFSNEREPITML